MEYRIDVLKIFTSPPRTMGERLLLFTFMLVLFLAFFGPIRFSRMNPLEAVLTAAFPSLTLSWGLVVLWRFFFKRSEYIQK